MSTREFTLYIVYNDRELYMVGQLACEIWNANYLKQGIECPGIFEKHWVKNDGFYMFFLSYRPGQSHSESQ